MFFFDPTWFLFAIPPLLFTLWAQYKVRSTFQKFSQVPNAQRLGGLDVARVLIRSEGLEHLKVNQVPGDLTDFYNPKDKSINLSQGSTARPSVAAMAIVAHELGHAVQDKQGYVPMRIRAGIVGIANIGSNLGYLLFFAGLMLGALAGSELGYQVAMFGTILFAASVAFTLVTLPVEFNASSRAREMLMRNGLVTQQDAQGVKAMLDAAALTYVAAAAQAIAQLLYFLSVLNRR
jgi:Zn-dependent membrane protease YugP